MTAQTRSFSMLQSSFGCHYQKHQLNPLSLVQRQPCMLQSWHCLPWCFTGEMCSAISVYLCTNFCTCGWWKVCILWCIFVLLLYCLLLFHSWNLGTVCNFFGWFYVSFTAVTQSLISCWHLPSLIAFPVAWWWLTEVQLLNKVSNSLCSS